VRHATVSDSDKIMVLKLDECMSPSLTPRVPTFSNLALPIRTEQINGQVDLCQIDNLVAAPAQDCIEPEEPDALRLREVCP
jgi:hypothetical protein